MILPIYCLKLKNYLFPSGFERVEMPENEPIRRFVPLPTQFLQEEEPSDIDEDDDEQNAEYNQPLAHFQHSAARSALTSAQDHHVQSFSPGRGISSNTFYGISQRNLVCFTPIF